MLQKVLMYDEKLFRLVNHNMENPLFDFIMPVISNPVAWIPVFLVGVVCGLVWGGKKFRYLLLISFISVSLSDFLCARVLKPSIKRIRPSYEVEGAIVRGKRGGKYSFPSNHASNVTALVYPFACVYGWFRFPAFLVVVMVCFSRVYLGVHYPLDVAGGVLTGMVIAVSLKFVFERYISDGEAYGKRKGKKSS